MAGIAEVNIIITGCWGTIKYAKRSNGSMPAKKYIDDLKKINKKEWLRLGALLGYMAEEGRVINEQKFKKLRNEIWEFKSDKHRILCFRKGNSWILTNCYKKESKKTPKREIDKSENIMAEHLGSY